MGFADNVRANRERLGLSQEELARRVGLTNSAVSQWEGGRAKPRIGVMKALSEIFGMTVSELLGEDAPGDGMREPVGRSGMVPMRRLGKTHAGSAVEEIPDDGMGGTVSQRVYSKALRATIKASGVPLHPITSLRNSWQTWMRWQLHVPPYIIEPIMGHSVPGVTGTYYDRPTPQMMLDAVASAYAGTKWDQS